MKKKTIISCFAIVATFLLFTFPMKLYALNYTISFTGTGASTSVESVVVQNLTKGTTVTVPTGNVLNLTDVTTFVDNIKTSAEHISVYPNPMQEKSIISFFAKSDGITQINVFSLEGKKIIGVTRNLSQGNRTFQLSMPKGVYVIQIQGNGFSYNAKAISQISSDCKAQIVFSDNKNQNTSKPQKSASAITTMLYTDGDQLLYKGISGNFSTIVTDKPSGNKTTNFDFVECKDADGNYYSVVKIGNQTWMAENLKTTTFKTGESISKVTNNSTWSNATFAAWCDYNDDVTNGIKYGKLYNWYATSDTRKIAPIGWHVPTDAEWTTLTSNLGGESVAGGKLKDLGTINWQTPNTAATNETGFSAFPCGYRSSDGTFGSEGDQGIWWSSIEINTSDAWFRSMNYNLSSVFRNKYPKQWGYSVRCIKDNIPTLSTTIASEITITSATCGGNITNDNGSTVTARGICWSTTSNPTISNSKTIDGAGIGIFTSSLTGLLPNTTYYLRAYATNDAGTGYGNELSFTTASETYNGDITISTIEDLNNFKNKRYKKIVGDLVINEISSITNLNLLGNTLEEVTGEIEIYGKYLTNLSGLDSLRNVGYFSLNGYSGNSFSGLGKLKYIKYDLYLTGVCRPLASFEGLENLTTIGGSLKLSSAMYDFHELRTFKGLDNLETIGRDLNLNSDFCNLESFDGLTKLKSIGGNLNLNKASTTSFVSFDKLINFNGLNSLISVGGSFNVLGSFDNLVSFEGLENLESIGGGFFGKGYASGDYSSYNSLKSFKGLTKLKVIKGNISIANDIKSSFNALTSFEGLDNVESIGGFYLLGGDGTSFSTLSSFKGLQSIKNITGSISIGCKNSQITSFSGWENLQGIGGYFTIYIPTIKSLEGLNKLNRIEQYFEINLCEKLSNIDALASLSHVGAIGFYNHLTISGCSRLFNFCSLKPLLESFNGTYSLTNNGYNPTQEQIKKGECSGE